MTAVLRSVNRIAVQINVMLMLLMLTKPLYTVTLSTSSPDGSTNIPSTKMTYVVVGTATGDNESYSFTSTGSTPQPTRPTEFHLSSEATPPAETLDEASSKVWQYVNGKLILTYAPPLLIVLATVGNTMSVVVLQNPMFRKSSTSFILSATAVVDALVVNVGLLRQWLLYTFGIDVRLVSTFGCQLHVFLTYFTRQLSSWSLVLLTTERVVSVWFPFHCKELCSRRRIVTAWCTIAFTLGCVNIHSFIIFDLQPVTSGASYACLYTKQYVYFINKQWFWIDACLRDFIPFGVIIVGNVFIVSKIVVANRLRAGQMQAAGAKDDKGKGQKVTSSTATLIVVSVVFLILNVPFDVYFLGLATGLVPLSTPLEVGTAQLFYSSVTIIFYTNNSINFLMYFASGRKFRSAFIDTISCRWCRGGDGSRHGAGKTAGNATNSTAVTKTTAAATRRDDVSMTTLSTVQ